MSTHAQVTHKWVTWTDWSQIKQVLVCLALVPQLIGIYEPIVLSCKYNWLEKKLVQKITRIPLRNAFPHEARDFTRWLEENIDVLNDCLENEKVTRL